ncbi:MAG: flagellar hook-associated protein FlgK [Thermodesulfobacteriota bacterium]
MSGILGLMDIAKRALAAEQLGVEVTSHNISNVNTPGYSRQLLYLETSTPIPSPWGPLGYGVTVTGIERAFDSFATVKLDENTSLLTMNQSIKSDLEQVASLFNETQDGGISQLLSGFWDAWNDLADNPSGAGERQSLLSQAQNLADAFNFRADQLVQMRTSITQEIGPTIQKINDYADQIAELNREIISSEVNGQQANDLRDQRNTALNNLSELVGIRYYTTGDGSINVTLPNGTSLVESVNSWSLSYQITPGDTVSVLWNGPGGTSLDVTSSISGGELSAQIQVRDTLIPQYQSDLDDLAKELVAQVNSQHSQGVGLDLFSTATSSNYVTNPGAVLINDPDLAFGNRIVNGTFTIHVEDSTGASTATPITIDGTTTLTSLAATLDAVAGISATVVTSGSENRLQITADSGYSFGFSQDTSNALMALGINTFFKGDSAWTIGVDDAVSNNVDLIATGQIDATTGAHPIGDNSNALLLADLGEQTVGPGGLTFSDAYQQIVTDIGLEAENAGDQMDYYQGLVDQFQEMRDSVSAVSLDEELTNLIKYQRAYQAAAKMVTTADEMLQTLLSLKT